MVTVPILERVAALGPNRSDLWSFSVAKYAAQGAQTGVDPFNADAGNGILNDGPPPVFVIGNDLDGASFDSSVAVDVNFQRGWVQPLVTTWGAGDAGNLRYYLLDNEPGIWHSSHRDVHPVGAGMDEVFAKMLSHALMIKQENPSAIVVGPEEWNWWGYFSSG